MESKFGLVFGLRTWGSGSSRSTTYSGVSGALRYAFNLLRFDFPRTIGVVQGFGKAWDILDTQWSRNSTPCYQARIKSVVTDTQNNAVTYFHRKGLENDKKKKDLKNNPRS